MPMFGTIDFAGTKGTDQYWVTAKYIERQETIRIVVAMEDAAFLCAMNLVIGGIEVKNSFAGKPLE